MTKIVLRLFEDAIIWQYFQEFYSQDYELVKLYLADETAVDWVWKMKNQEMLRTLARSMFTSSL